MISTLLAFGIGAIFLAAMTLAARPRGKGPPPAAVVKTNVIYLRPPQRRPASEGCSPQRLAIIRQSSLLR